MKQLQKNTHTHSFYNFLKQRQNLIQGKVSMRQDDDIRGQNVI